MISDNTEDGISSQADATFKSVVRGIVNEPLAETLAQVRSEGASLRQGLDLQRQQLQMFSRALGDASLPELRRQLEELEATMAEVADEQSTDQRQMAARMRAHLDEVRTGLDGASAGRHSESQAHAREQQAGLADLNARVGVVEHQIGVLRGLLLVVLVLNVLLVAGAVITVLT